MTIQQYSISTENILVTADSRIRANHQYKYRCILASTNSFFQGQSRSGTTAQRT